jgi:uncharacterized membrane protein YbhN (UPF0104 family)
MSTYVNAQTVAASLPAAKDRARKLRKTAIRSLATVVLLTLLFWQIPLRDVWGDICGMDVSSLIVVLILAVPTQYLQFVRWATLAKDAGPGVSRADIHRGFWVGYTLGLITPGRIGQYGRALALHNCSLARAAGLTFLERTYSALVINGLGLIAVVLLPLLGWVPPYPNTGILVSIVCLAAGAAVLGLGIFPALLSKPLLWVTRRLPFGSKLARAVDVLSLVSPRRGAWLLALAALGLASALLQFVVLLYALKAPVPLFAGMLAALLTFFLKGNIPIGIGNLGVGEWTAVICLAGLGVKAPVAVSASLVLFFINVFVPGLIGLPFMSSLRMPDLHESREATS